MFAITMGQAFRSKLEVVIEAAGGKVLSAGYADGSASWIVLAQFAKGTRQRDVTQLVWAKWPNAAVAVKKAAYTSR